MLAARLIERLDLHRAIREPGHDFQLAPERVHNAPQHRYLHVRLRHPLVNARLPQGGRGPDLPGSVSSGRASQSFKVSSLTADASH
jgi:hypothetical protein